MKFQLAIIAILATGAAYAQPSDKFRGLDRNSDGFLQGGSEGDRRLCADEFVKSEASTDVKVESNQGRVLLSGFVDSEDQKKRVVSVATRVEGVKKFGTDSMSANTQIRGQSPNSLSRTLE